MESSELYEKDRNLSSDGETGENLRFIEQEKA